MNAPLPPTVLLVDDDHFNREGQRLYLEMQGWQVCEAADELSGWQQAQQLLTAAVIDISIPPDPYTPSRVQHSFGLRLARNLKQAQPMLGVVLFSAYEDRGGEVLEMIREGMRGLAYKLKGCAPGALLEALDEVRLGRVLIDPEVTSPRTLVEELRARLTPEERPWVEYAAAHLSALTPREREVVYRLAQSEAPDGIALELGVAVRTVEHHLGSIYHKLGVYNLPNHFQRVIILTKACMIYDLLTSVRR